MFMRSMLPQRTDAEMTMRNNEHDIAVAVGSPSKVPSATVRESSSLPNQESGKDEMQAG